MKHTFALFACLVAIFLAAALLAGCGGSNSRDDSQPGHTAPTGMWGGTLVSDAAEPATLTLTTSGGQFVFPCGETAAINQEIQPDSSGSFSAAGTVTSGLAGQSTTQPAQFTGNITNHVMMVTLKVTPASGTPFILGPYSVTLGQTAPAFQGACPG